MLPLSPLAAQPTRLQTLKAQTRKFNRIILCWTKVETILYHSLNFIPLRQKNSPHYTFRNFEIRPVATHSAT